jgi:membrane fusion protein (multidrug efflux system)
MLIVAKDDQRQNMPERLKHLRRHKNIILILAALAVASGALVYYVVTRDKVSTDDAFVDGHIFIITPRVSGYVTKVEVTDNERVKKGQPLVILDPIPYEVALAQVKANLAQARFNLASLELGVPLQLAQTSEQVHGATAQLESLYRTLEEFRRDEDAAAQEVKRLQAQLRLSELDLARKTALKKGGAISQQTLDDSQTSYQATLAQLRGAEAKLESVKKQREAQESNIELRKSNIALAATGEEQAEIKARETEAQRARVDLAKTQVKKAELDLSYTRIVSPTDGYVTQKRIEAGQFVSPGQQLFAVVPLDPANMWITANYKETDLTYVRPGQPVTIKVDTYPGVKIRGKVDSIMAGTGAAFSLFPPENATGNFVKVVQRMPVKISLAEDQRNSLPVLRIGMSVVPTIYTGQASSSEYVTGQQK